MQVKECISNFFTQCCRPMGLLLQTFGHNRARQRDKIASLLEEFAAIQEDVSNRVFNRIAEAILTRTLS